MPGGGLIPIPLDSIRGSIKLSPIPYILAISSPLLPILLLIIWELVNRRNQQLEPSGCRKLGLRMRSNLHDQFKSMYSTAFASEPGTDNNGAPKWKVKALFVYPVKSCCPVELHRGDVVETGLKHDRQFSFAQRVPAGEKTSHGTSAEEHWQFITQRQFPTMSKIRTELWVPDPQSASYRQNGVYERNGGCMVLTFPSALTCSFTLGGLQNIAKIIAAKISAMSLSAEPTISCRVPLLPSAERIARTEYPIEKMTIWKDSPEALNMTSEIPERTLARLKTHIGVKHPVALFRVDPSRYREVYRCAARRDVAGYQPVTGFSDAYPIHIANLASVHDLASNIPKTGPKRLKTSNLDALRFRANIYVTGPPAFVEDHWTLITISGIKYQVACRCVRCKLPNVDPDTGVPDLNQPLSILNSYRRIDKGATFGPCLGMNLVPLIQKGKGMATEGGFNFGSIKVGDELKLLETGDHFYIKQ